MDMSAPESIAAKNDRLIESRRPKWDLADWFEAICAVAVTTLMLACAGTIFLGG